MLGVGDDLHTDLQTSLGYRVRREMIKTQPEQSHSLPHDDYGPDYIFSFIPAHHIVTDDAERNVMSVRVSFRVSRGSKPIWWMTERTVMKGNKTALGEASPVE